MHLGRVRAHLDRRVPSNVGLPFRRQPSVRVAVGEGVFDGALVLRQVAARDDVQIAHLQARIRLGGGIAWRPVHEMAVGDLTLPRLVVACRRIHTGLAHDGVDTIRREQGVVRALVRLQLVAHRRLDDAAGVDAQDGVRWEAWPEDAESTSWRFRHPQPTAVQIRSSHRLWS